MGKFVDLFPLSVFRDALQLDQESRSKLCTAILQMEQHSGRPSETDSDSESAWLGDTSGFEFLFRDKAFVPLFALIAAAIKEYSKSLGLNNDALNFYFQRSWATVSREGERIFEHAHVQSHLSFAYYLQKPTDGGGIYFSVAEHPNEFAAGLFTLSKESAGVISEPSARTLNQMYVEPAEGEILIFPSKTLHSTAPNMTTTPRISISADVVITLKDSSGHETLMPPVDRWQAF